TKHHLAARPRRGLAQKKPQLLLQQCSVLLSHHCPVGPRGTWGVVDYSCSADESENARGQEEKTHPQQNRYGTSGRGRENVRMHSRCSGESPMNSKPCTKPARCRTTARKTSGSG